MIKWRVKMRINKTQKSHNKSFKKLIILSAVALLVVTGGILGALYLNKTDSSPKDENTINYDAPTQEELDSSQDGKKNSEQQGSPESEGSSSSESESSTKRAVSVAVTYAGAGDEGVFEVRAFIDGVIEGSGTCTATLTKDGRTVTKSSPAFVDASSSICEPIYINKSQLSSGSWGVVVSYNSPDAVGVSSSTTMEVK